MKYYRFGWRDLLYDISYPNIVMLSASIPDYSAHDGDNGKGGIHIDASDPDNNVLIEKLFGAH